MAVTLEQTVPCRESGPEDNVFLSSDPLYIDPILLEFLRSLMQAFLPYALQCIYNLLQWVYRYSFSTGWDCTLNQAAYI